MKALFLVNARSGANRRLDVASVIRAECDWKGYGILSCEQREDLDSIIAEAEKSGYDAVFAVGGDGTVHEVAKRLIGSPLALGVIPTGSGNGVARHLGIPVGVRQALLRCRDFDTAEIDTAEVNGVPFIGVMGVGFDAWIAHEFAKHADRGMKTYVKAALSGVAAYKPAQYEVEHDGEVTTHSAYMITVANTSQYGDNARIAPLASVTDGLLDVVIVHDAALLRVPFIAAQLFTGRMHHSGAVITERTAGVVIRRASPGPAHVDGEPVELGLELKIRVHPRSLRVIVPRTARTI